MSPLISWVHQLEAGACQSSVTAAHETVPVHDRSHLVCGLAGAVPALSPCPSGIHGHRTPLLA
jgi:hypothetical protein